MSVLSRFIFGLVSFAARNGLSEPPAPAGVKKQAARRTGMQDETFPYWYLRRKG
jgi:hypothetical protein